MSGVYAGRAPRRICWPRRGGTRSSSMRGARDRSGACSTCTRGLLRQELGPRRAVDALLFSSLARPATAVLRGHDRGRRLRSAPGALGARGRRHEEGAADGCAWMRVTGPPGSIVAAARRRSARDRPAGCSIASPAMKATPADVRRRARRARPAAQARGSGSSAARRAPPGVGVALGGRRHAASRRPRAPARGPLRAVSPDGERRRRGRGRGRRARAERQRRTAGTCSGTATCTCCRSSPRPTRARRGRCSSTASGGCPRRCGPRARRARGRAASRGSRRASGEDVTPAQARDRRGEIVPVLTGELEEHIVADVAWAAACYIDWTGDEAFAAGPGRELIVQTARWWASRIELDDDGRGPHPRRDRPRRVPRRASTTTPSRT